MSGKSIWSVTALGLLLTIGTCTAPAQNNGAPPQNGGRPGEGQRGGGRNGRGIRGTVVSVNGPSAVIKTETGERWTVITTDNTRISIDGQTIKAAALKTGDEILAGGIPDNEKHEMHALFVGGASAAQAAKLKADLGKTYIVGRITAISEAQLTILRPDKVSQTIALDESTSLHRGGRLPPEFAMFGGGGGGGRRRDTPGTPNATSGGDQSENGESITLADVKVGDNVSATGAVKSGVFTPAELHVQTPRPRGERGADNGDTPPPVF